MVQEQAADGQNSGQESSGSEGSDSGKAPKGGEDDRFEKMEARFELLNGSISDLRSAILESRRTTAQAPVQEDNDDEPLTPSKVRKIVQSSVANASAANQSLAERREWDQKAKSEFPLSDPKFLLEFKREWGEQTAAGLDPNHPRAVYNVAKIVARAVGTKKPAPRDAETAHTSEAPTNSPRERQQSSRTTRTSVRDDDPRLQFYMMKGNRTKEQIESVRQKLSERDARGSKR